MLRILLLLLLLPTVALADRIEQARQMLDRFEPEALAALQTLTSEEPRNVEALRLLALAQLRAGEPGAAVATLERVVRLEPRRAELHHLLGQAYASNINYVGTLGQLSYAGKIRRSFAKAVELDPELLDARFGLLQFYLQAPGIAGGSVSRARDQAAEIAARNPSRGYMARAQLLVAEDKHTEALAAYREAVAIDPNRADARMALSLQLHRIERSEEALDVLATMQQELPNAGQGWYQFGRIALLTGLRLEAGEAALRRFLELPRADGLPEPHYAHLRLGQILAARGQREAAQTEWQRALALKPDFAEALAALAGQPGG